MLLLIEFSLPLSAWVLWNFCMLGFLLRISLFKETININEDANMIGLLCVGFLWARVGLRLPFFSGKDLARQLFQAYGWPTDLSSYVLIIPAPTPIPPWTICQNSYSAKKLVFIKGLALSMLMTSTWDTENKEATLLGEMPWQKLLGYYKIGPRVTIF